MNGEQCTLPLSPPLSPSMTNQSARIDHWRHQIEQEDLVDPTHEPKPATTIANSSLGPTLPISERSQSFYEPLYSHYHDWSGCETTHYTATATLKPLAPSPQQPGANADLPRAIHQLSARPAGADERDRLHAVDEDIELSDFDADEEPGNSSLTVAELRAHNRRLRRFRLTHSQTRYLMSEFARQPRPDAAHRERLSREIPGFSGRQVQVWFQNRRAKLKRLTKDDRDRVLRSRALPANFDMTQALQSPFTSSRSAFQPPVQSSAQTSDFNSWNRPTHNIQHVSKMTANQTRYHDRQGYSTPPEPVLPMVQPSTSYMATPASLPSKAPSPQHALGHTTETPAINDSPHSTRYFNGSHSMHQHSYTPFSTTNHVQGPSEIRNIHSRQHSLQQGHIPPLFQPEQLPQQWHMPTPESAASELAHGGSTVYSLHAQPPFWHQLHPVAAHHAQPASLYRYQSPQERGIPMVGHKHESINFEPLYRQPQ